MQKYQKALILVLVCALLSGVLCACADDAQPAVTFRDTVISDHMYSFWLSCCKSDFLRAYGGTDSDAFWSTALDDGRTAEDLAKELLLNRVYNYAAAAQLFREYKLKIPKETTQAIEADIAEKIDYYGGRDKLNEYLAKMDANTDVIQQVFVTEQKLEVLCDYLYGTDGVYAVTESDVDAYYAQHYSRIRYILFYTEKEYEKDESGKLLCDDNGNYITRDLTDEEKAQKQSAIEAALSALADGESFDTVKKTYDEYPFDASYYENGFHVSINEVGTFGTAMVKAASEMKPGETRRVDDELCTYIILKETPLTVSQMKACDTEQIPDLRADCIAQKFQDLLLQYREEMTVDTAVTDRYSFRSAYPNSLIQFYQE